MKTLLAEAVELCGRYEWVAAANQYERASKLLASGTDTREMGRVTELAAGAWFKGAFQSENREEFKRRMELAQALYNKATVLYDGAGQEGRAKIAKAREVFARFWTKDKPEERRSLTEKAIETAEESAKFSELLGDKVALAEAHKHLLWYYVEELALDREWSLNWKLAGKAVLVGETAVKEYSDLGDDMGLLESLHFTAVLLGIAAFFSERARIDEFRRKASDLSSRIWKVSKRIGTPDSSIQANESTGIILVNTEGDVAKGLQFFEKALGDATKTRDAYLIGRLLNEIGVGQNGVGASEEDGDHKREMMEKAILMGTRALSYLQIPNQGLYLSSATYAIAESYVQLGYFVETDLEGKRTLLGKAVEIARKGIERENHTLPSNVQHSLAKALYFLATMETDREKKSRLLNEALRFRQEDVQAGEFCLRPDAWINGRGFNYLALIKAELSGLEDEPSKKASLLGGAVSDMEKCITICGSYLKVDTWFASQVTLYYEWYGDILSQLNSLVKNPDSALSAVNNYEKAISCLEQLGHLSSQGPLRWKIAKSFDSLGRHEEASRSFRKAAENYMVAAEKVRGPTSFFRELSYYMEGWALIEDARVHHEKEEYWLASEDYKQASSLIKSTKNWSLLSSHYDACGLLEQGEALSREEKPDKAAESFSAASTVFKQARAELEGDEQKSARGLEKRELEDWLRITQRRQEYALARAELESAKVLDRKGDEEASARSYRSASEAFRGLLREGPTEQSRSELETLMFFCEAWGRMKEAEIQASPQLYAEASSSFMKAKEATMRKRFRLLAMADASTCRALESGSRFRQTQDIGLYSEIKRQMQVAADYYHEAGFGRAADWARATQRLFDALAYTASAESEIDAKKKTEFYHLAQKHLELAAKLFDKAGYSSRKEEVLRHLERVREEKELLLTPVEALADSPAVAGVAVAPVSLVRDQAVGLERFDVANVVGNLSVHEKDVGVGSEITLELEMANVGKTAATLMKLENLAPDGLELDKGRLTHRSEGDFIDLRGKRLEYLKTHEVKVPMKAKRKGAFQLCPRILFVDEKGTYRSYDFEPVALTVTELGISGWLKGPK